MSETRLNAATLALLAALGVGLLAFMHETRTAQCGLGNTAQVAGALPGRDYVELPKAPSAPPLPASPRPASTASSGDDREQGSGPEGVEPMMIEDPYAG